MTTDHSDYAEQARAEMLAENWLKAAQLWRKAIDACSNRDTQSRSARRPTSATRRSPSTPSWRNWRSRR